MTPLLQRWLGFFLLHSLFSFVCLASLTPAQMSELTTTMANRELTDQVRLDAAEQVAKSWSTEAVDRTLSIEKRQEALRFLLVSGQANLDPHSSIAEQFRTLFARHSALSLAGLTGDRNFWTHGSAPNDLLRLSKEHAQTLLEKNVGNEFFELAFALIRNHLTENPECASLEAPAYQLHLIPRLDAESKNEAGSLTQFFLSNTGRIHLPALFRNFATRLSPQPPQVSIRLLAALPSLPSLPAYHADYTHPNLSLHSLHPTLFSAPWEPESLPLTPKMITELVNLLDTSARATHSRQEHRMIFDLTWKILLHSNQQGRLSKESFTKLIRLLAEGPKNYEAPVNEIISFYLRRSGTDIDHLRQTVEQILQTESGFSRRISHLIGLSRDPRSCLHYLLDYTLR